MKRWIQNCFDPICVDPTLADKRRPRRWGARVQLAVWAVLLMAGLCSGQNAPSVGGPYNVAGRVVNASTGEPVRRATIAVVGEQDGGIVESTQTDAEGRFALEHLAAGKYPLTASRRGYRTGFYDEHEEYNSAIVTGPDQDTTHLEFKLTPEAVIYGVITGDGGEPVENANVAIFKRERGGEHGASGDIKEVSGAVTDDTGAYEFTGLEPGEYLIAVIASPWYAMHPPSGPAGADVANENSALDVAYPVTYFDSTTDEASASPIAVEAGGRQEADIALHAVPALRLQAPVAHKASGIVQPELRTMVFGKEISSASSGGFDSTHPGMAEFNGLAPGHYELLQGNPARISEIDASTSGAIDPNAGALAMAVTGALRSTGPPLPENVNVMLESVAGGNRQPMQMNAHRGEFRFDAVPPGNWALSASAQGNALPVVAVWAGGGAIAGNQITVKDRPVSVVAIVSPTLTRVQGFARRGGKGVAGAMIVLIPEQRSAYRALARRDQSDSDGSFNLRDVPAGRYTVVAIEDGWKLDWTDREAIARYLPQGVSVTVSDQAGGAVSLTAPVPVQ